MDAAERWRSAGLREVLLPSGTWVRGVLPTAERLLISGGLPGELRAEALAFAAREGKPRAGAELEPESDVVREWLAFIREMAAAFPREVLDETQDGPVAPRHGYPGHECTGTWQDARFGSGSELTESNLEPDDIAMLEGLVMRQLSTDTVTSYSRALRGELPAPPEGEADTVAKWAGFRGDRPGAAPGEDSRDMALPPVRAARAARPRGAPRARRGVGDPAAG